jgi:hypothetical protein
MVCFFSKKEAPAIGAQVDNVRTSVPMVEKKVNQSLVMQMTQEQGGNRTSQVQPPKNVWVYFSELDFDNLPVLQMTNRKIPGAAAENRPVVEHDHNWTIELDGAYIERPAIIRFTKTGVNSFDYWVYTPQDHEYGALDYTVNAFPNPTHIRGRRWVTI